MHTFQVIIVGAGVAGLSAARTLIQNGIDNILIIEAKEKPGGRIQSIPCGSANLELGAQWLHGEENELFDLANLSNNVHEKNSWEGKGDFLTPSGQRINDEIVEEIVDWLEFALGDVEDNYTIETLQDEPDKWPNDESMGSYLRREFEKYLIMRKEDDDPALDPEKLLKLRNAVFQWGMSFQRIDNSCNQMSELSLFRWSEYKSNGPHVYKNFRFGAQNFVNNVLMDTKLESKLRLNTPISCINWNDSTIRVFTAATSNDPSSEVVSFQCESIIVTCSIGVLKETQGTLFTPQLPASLANALNSTGFGPVTKIFLEWEDPWWSEDFLGLQFTWPEDGINSCDFEYGVKPDCSQNWYKAITGFDPVLDNGNVLLAWLGGPEAIYAEGLSQSQLGETCAKIIRQFTGKENVADPTSVYISKWNTDPYFRGAYSFRSKIGDRIPGEITSVLSEPVYKLDVIAKKKPTILLAGEAMHSEYYSTLHGAYESGQDQAKKIIQYYERKESIS